MIYIIKLKLIINIEGGSLLAKFNYKSGNINSGNKIEVLIITILLLISGLSIIGIVPGFLGAELQPDLQHESSSGSNSRGSPRSVDYDMNLSRTGKHQDLTIYGRRGLYLPFETLPPINITTVGDVNGDGFDDLIIGAPGDNNTFALNDAGVVYVYFGASSLPSTYDLRNHTGLIIEGADPDDLQGAALAACDFNDDGIDDIITGAPYADGQGNLRTNSGEVYIFYGGSYLTNLGYWNLSSSVANTTIFGNNSGDFFGSYLAVGNINLDTYDDLIVGAPGGDGVNPLAGVPESGEAVVIFGNKSTFPIEDLNLSTSFNFTTIYGEDMFDRFGAVVAGGGDFNGDGIEDIAVSAPDARGPGDAAPNHGEVCVIFWNDNISKFIDLNDFSINANLTVYGARSGDNLGEYSAILSDITGDNLAELIVGAPNANGISGSGPSDSGATYIINGTQMITSNENWDLFFKNADHEIYFPTAGDESGSWLDSFDWNDDGIDDILISAPYGDGPSNNFNNVGEVICINGSPSLPPVINLQTFDPPYLFFGSDNGDRFGHVIAHGDLNGDSYLDLISLADYADGKNEVRIDGGEIYVIFGVTSKIPILNSFKLVNGDGVQGDQCYTKYKSYQFEVNLTSPLENSDVVNVSLTLDPFDLNLKYHWDGSFFTEVRDPNDIAQIDISSSSQNIIDTNNQTITFGIDFDWTCPRVDSVPVRVDFYNAIGFRIWSSHNNIFSIENRLNFTGALVVKGENDRVLNSNDWVKKSEALKWSGLTVVYEGTTDVYPNVTEYEVKLWNDTRSWTDASPAGSPINLSITSGVKSLSYDNYTINITEIPNASDVSDISFQLRLDADNIEFSEPVPDPEAWQNVSTVTCGITVTDIGGTQVDGSTMEYRTSLDNGTKWSNWTSVGIVTKAGSIPMTKNIQFIDGIENMIQWRGNDTIGNGYATSETYSIKVDTVNVTFSNPTPQPGDILSSTNVSFSIDIYDETSGVNESTIAYSYSMDNGETWSSWISLNLTGVNHSVHVSTNKTFIPGYSNFIKWRALDVAGNGYNVTEPQQINISIPTKDLKVYLIAPTNNTEVSSGNKTLMWWSTDNSSTIVFNVYFSTDEDKVISLSSDALVAQDIRSNEFTTDTLQNNTRYFWTVIPRDITGKIGFCADGVWNFKINPTVIEYEYPVFTVEYPLNGSEISTLKPALKWSMKYKHYTTGTFDLYLGTSEDDLTLEKAGIKRDTYTLERNLKNHVTYYWSVKVVVGDIKDPYPSPIWNFNINMSSVIQQAYDFRLHSNNPSIKIKQGERKDFVFSVINLKNASTVEFTAQSNIQTTSTTNMFTFSPVNVSLGTNEDREVTLTINIPKDVKGGNYVVTIVGEMRVSGDVIQKDLDVDVEVEAKKDTDGDGIIGDDSSMLYAIVGVVVIIIIVVLLLLFILMKRKKKEEGEPLEEPRAEEEIPPAEGLPMAEALPPEEVPGAELAMPVTPPAAEPVPPGEPIPEETLEGAPPLEAAPPEAEGVPPEAAPPAEAPPEGAPTEPIPTEPGVPEAEAPPEAAEPELPSDLPSDAFEQPPPAAPPAAPPAPEAPVEPQPPEQPEGETAKTEEKPKDDENA